MKNLTQEQFNVLLKLNRALKEASDTGLLDELAGMLHPDIINQFCDAVGEMLEDSL